MDPLTHMLVGALVADSLSAPKRLGRRALPGAMLIAAAPDVDVAPALIAAFPANPFTTRLFDADMMRLWHRGPTHAFAVVLVAGLILGACARLWSGGAGGWWRWGILFSACLASHLVLDLCNGPVQLWWPVSSAWVGWGQAREGNLLLLIVLGLCVLINHPLKFRNPRGLGTLAALEKGSDWLRQRAGERIEPALLAACCLAAGALIIIVDMRCLA